MHLCAQGELVYKRKDISIAREQHKWLYVGRKVRDNELSNPVKLLKKVERKAKETGEFKALKTYGATSNAAVQDSCNIQDRNDGMLRLYGIWQTNVWKPNPVLPHDPIPVNQYRNIEKALINPGLVHLEYHRISIVAKKLGIPYAPCLLGFDFKAGDTKPKIKGIVVHEHNAILLREAHAEWNDHALEQEEHKRKSEIYKGWRRLVIGLRTKQRLEKEYGGGL
uniref:Rad4 beta-hairpin domain-containing protein n=1 Tax=Proboscia inermis TaxID=420281 RepID=A0A7S0GG90_9STRA|mmetsp:Transcript_38127/g.38495  ORF Transcript_38127/g.38495 Transcript_38127/m.38495 type:complete len:223 (+) Transcript_38127:69-737(+)